MIYILAHNLSNDKGNFHTSTIFKVDVLDFAPDKFEDVGNRSFYIPVVHFLPQGRNEDMENSSFPQGVPASEILP